MHGYFERGAPPKTPAGTLNTTLAAVTIEMQLEAIIKRMYKLRNDYEYNRRLQDEQQGILNSLRLLEELLAKEKKERAPEFGTEALAKAVPQTVEIKVDRTELGSTTNG